MYIVPVHSEAASTAKKNGNKKSKFILYNFERTERDP